MVMHVDGLVKTFLLCVHAIIFAGLATITSKSSVASPPDLPTVSCKQAWSRLIQKNQHTYNFDKDSKSTDAGNLGYSAYAKRVNRRDCYKDWSVLVYMAADNDLTPYAYWDLYEMESGFAQKENRVNGGSSVKTDLVVQLDTAGNRGIRRLHIFQTKEPYNSMLRKADFDKRTEKDIRSPIIPEQIIQEDHGSEAERFREFLDWGVNEYPSKHYMVIVWGHGQGWTPARPATLPVKSRYIRADDPALPPPPKTEPTVGTISAPASNNGKAPFRGRNFGGLAFNYSKGTYLDIPSLKASIGAVFPPDRRLDIYASDACLMQMVEVATELSPVTRFIVGSTQVQNFLGLPYRRLLHFMNRESGSKPDSPFELAKMIPEIFRASMTPGGLQGHLAPDGVKSITMSTISSDELGTTLIPRLGLFSTAMSDYIHEEPLRAMDVQFVLNRAPRFQGGAQDIGAFLALTKLLLNREAEKKNGFTRAATNLEQAIDDTHDALDRTVLSYILGTQYSDPKEKLYLLNMRAFSAWLPISADDYKGRIRTFTPSMFYNEVPWGNWLSTVFTRRL